MSRIALSLSGEGRGHTARTLALLEMFGDLHEMMVLAPTSALDLLRPSLQKFPHVQLHVLPHLRFQYGWSGRLSYSKSWLMAAPFIARLRKHVRSTVDSLVEFRPDIAISDFEPVLPRAALALHLPLISLDHQHFLAAMDTRVLPLSLRWKARFLRPSVKLFCPVADVHLVSSFFKYPSRRSTEHFEQVGVLLRRDFGRIPTRVGDHLLVYARRSQSRKWLSILSNCGLPVKVYGMQQQRPYFADNIQFCPISAGQFMEDLATCRALITTAGNQLVGEALAASKPVLAVPEPGNFEQQLNGHFLQASGMGVCLKPSQFNERRLSDFLDDLDQFRERTAAFDRIGNETVRSVVASMLPSAPRRTEPTLKSEQGMCA